MSTTICVSCGSVFWYSDTTPRLRVDGVSKPACINCFARWNELNRTRQGLPTYKFKHGAYATLEGKLYMTDTQYSSHECLACPACAKDTVERGEFDQDTSGTTWRDNECTSCGATWTDVFVVSGYENLQVVHAEPEGVKKKHEPGEWLEFLTGNNNLPDEAKRLKRMFTMRVSILIEGFKEDPDLEYTAFMAYCTLAEVGYGTPLGTEGWHGKLRSKLMNDPIAVTLCYQIKEAAWEAYAERCAKQFGLMDHVEALKAVRNDTTFH